jgi:hypothetical protein
MIEIVCARCGRLHYAGQEHLGKHLRCGGCGDKIPIYWQNRHPADTRQALQPQPKQDLKGIANVREMAKGKRRFSHQFLVAILILGLITLICVLVRGKHSHSNAGPVQVKAPYASSGTPSGDKHKEYQSGDIPGRSAQNDFSAAAPSVRRTVPAKRKLPKVIELDPSEVEQVDPQGIPPKSLPTGTKLFEDRATGGNGELEAVNGTSYDAVVMVVDAGSGTRYREVYIKAQDTSIMHRLDSGSYLVLFATGVGWNESTEQFERQAAYYQFGKTLAFEETSDRYAVHYEHHTITLHAVPRGNVRVKSLTLTEFHALSGIADRPK